MLKLQEGEKIIMAVHKHWFEVARAAVVFVIMLFVPPLALTFLPLITSGIDTAAVNSVTNFGLALYTLVLIILLFLLWMDHYLDMWIITTERIIDIQQNGLFNRKVSEIPLDSVQDITIEIKGFVETFLKFGTIRIQTAGERDFTIGHVPDLYRIKDAILENAAAKGKLMSEGARNYVRTQQVDPNKT